MNCSRCAAEVDEHHPEFVAFGLVGATSKVHPICRDCSRALSTFWHVRKDEFTVDTERSSSELMHACRMALDIANPHPDIRDVLRTAIKNAYEGMKK